MEGITRGRESESGIESGKMDGREECKIVTEYWRKKNTEKERE
jgi:hypothetical protein